MERGLPPFTDTTVSSPTFSSFLSCSFLSANAIDLVQMRQNGLGLPLSIIPFSSYSLWFLICLESFLGSPGPQILLNYSHCLNWLTLFFFSPGCQLSSSYQNKIHYLNSIFGLKYFVNGLCWTQIIAYRKKPRRKNVGENSGNFRSGCRSVWEVSYEVEMTRIWSKIPTFLLPVMALTGLLLTKI